MRIKCKNVKILFVLKKRNYGYGPSFGLSNSCAFVGNALFKYGIEFKVVEVIDGNGIDKEVHDYDPTHVILEAVWTTSAKIIELLELYKKKRPNMQWNVRIHSNSPFLSRESVIIQWVREYAEIAKKYKNFSISANNKRLVQELKLALGIKIVYLPNIYCPPDYPNQPKKQDKFLDIACFGAIRELKAIFPQAVAAMIYGNLSGQRIRFHINCNRIEEKNNAILKNLIALFDKTKHELVLHEWMLHKDLIELIQKQIDIGMAVSFSESYGITAYDYVINDVPVVGSKEIESILCIFKANPTEYTSIVKKLRLADLSRLIKIHYFNKCLLNRSNEQSIQAWLKYLC